MSALLDWLEARTGLPTTGRQWLDRPVAGGPAWRCAWPAAILFGVVVQGITGMALWMFYSPSAQTAWESVYFIENHVLGGWLLRALHHYNAQVLVALVGLYVLQMLFRGAYRAPRELVFGSAVLLGLVALGSALTGDLLAWDQNGFWSTRVRVGFLTLLPGVGADLFKLAAGGPAFGHHTLTRFFALHAGVLPATFVLLLLLHAYFARRAEREPAAACPYWPRQAACDMAACLVVLVVAGLLALQHGTAGVGLGAPADPAAAYAAARPEWSFRGLYQFANIFPGNLKILPIFVIPGLLVLWVLAMPWIGRRPIGHRFNQGFMALLLVALAVLSYLSYAHDAADEKCQAALAAGRREAARALELAAAPEGIPAAGALTLMRNDPKIQGPKLFLQHCASCHDHADAQGQGIRAEKSSAPNLYGFADRRWIAGLLDPKQIAGPNYFGNTKFRTGDMAGFVKDSLVDLEADEQEDLEKAVAALSAEAGLGSQQQLDATQAAAIEQGREILADGFGCTDCHRFRGKGSSSAPDLNGYGSAEWTAGIIANPADKRFYGPRNDRMPAYAAFPHEPAKNILSPRDIELLIDWLRGEWHEAAE